ncbi:MAG: type II toxin-antitoxin system MqsA family antitoxin [Proteobacteria bacterium]|nr:type II toxin-antitoxin system MqsA family antitoxin [Pseudomonadota bacterium]
MKSNRDIGQEILDSIKSIKQGKGKKHIVEVPDDVVKIRQNLALSQSAFSALLGVSVRTLQDWEQGRRTPRGPALSLLRIAKEHPEVFIEH